MTLLQAFEISGTVVSIIAILGVGAKLLETISDIKAQLAVLKTDMTWMKAALNSALDRHAPTRPS